MIRYKDMTPFGKALLWLGPLPAVVLTTLIALLVGRPPEDKLPPAPGPAAPPSVADSFHWPSFLEALEEVEAPRTEEQAQAAIEREGAYGVLQIRQPALDDVNRKYGTSVTLEQVQGSRTLSRWACVHYLRMYGADTDYETAARTWNGGPRGPTKEATLAYWHRVRGVMLAAGVEP